MAAQRPNAADDAARLRQLTTRVAALVGDDPLGADLGAQRVLRTSPLTPVPAVC